MENLLKFAWVSMMRLGQGCNYERCSDARIRLIEGWFLHGILLVAEVSMLGPLLANCEMWSKCLNLSMPWLPFVKWRWPQLQQPKFHSVP